MGVGISEWGSLDWGDLKDEQDEGAGVQMCPWVLVWERREEAGPRKWAWPEHGPGGPQGAQGPDKSREELHVTLSVGEDYQGGFKQGSDSWK